MRINDQLTEEDLRASMPEYSPFIESVAMVDDQGESCHFGGDTCTEQVQAQFYCYGREDDWTMHSACLACLPASVEHNADSRHPVAIEIGQSSYV